MTEVVNNNNNRWWQLFRTGAHTSSNGTEFIADENIIDTIIASTKKRDYANDEIPICIGHKKDDSPKWGAFNKNSFKRAGAFLLGRHEYLVKEFAEAVTRRMFDKVSLALYPDYSIKHVAVLGIQAPAIKGLELITLSSSEEPVIEIEFTEAADAGLNRDMFAAVKNLIRFLSGFPYGEIINVNNNKRAIMKTAEELEWENQALVLALSEKEEELKSAKQKELLTEIKMFCESGEVKNKVTPALKPHVEKLYAVLKNESVYEFAEGESTIKISPVDAFKNLVLSLPDAVEFNEKATKENAAIEEPLPDVNEFAEMNINEESMELHKKALKIQSADKCSYTEAVRKAAAGQ